MNLRAVRNRCPLLLLMLLLCAVQFPSAALAACENTGVPGTPYDGFASGVTGGAGQAVYTVNTLSASVIVDPGGNSGSLAGATTLSNRCIVFSVSGTITVPLTNPAILRWAGKSNVTIDGFSAPSPGITIAVDTTQGNLSGNLMRLDGVNNFIVRGLRFDCKDRNNGLTEPNDQGCIPLSLGNSSGNPSQNFVISQNTFLRAGNDTITLGESHDGAILGNIFYDPWEGHPTCMLGSADNVTVARNLFGPGCKRRNPWHQAGLMDLRNNLFWSVGGNESSSNTGPLFRLGASGNIVANYLHAAPTCDEDVTCQQKMIVVCPESGVSQCTGDAGTVYVADNVTGHGASVTAVVNSKGNTSSELSADPLINEMDACSAAYAVRENAGARNGSSWGLNSTEKSMIDSIPTQLPGCPPPAGGGGGTVTFEGAGAVVDTTSANPSVPLPSGIQANDIVWIHCAVKNTSIDHIYPSGFTRVDIQNSGGVRHSLGWKRMSGGESGAVTMTISGSDLKVCRASLWRGVRTSGNPYEEIETASQLSQTSVDPPSVSVTNGAMVVAFTASDNNFGGIDAMSGGTGTETPTTAYHYDTSTSNDATLALFYAAPTTTGLVDLGSDTNIGGTVSTRSYTLSLVAASASDTTAPAAPTGLVATAVSSTEIDLDWSDNTEGDLAGYNVYRSTTPGFTPGAGNRIATDLASSSYSDSGLSTSTTYYYKVTAVDTSSNESSPSSEASAATPAPGGFTDARVFEDCNRTEDPLSNGGKWTTDIGGGQASWLVANGSTCTKSTVSGVGSAWWNNQTFGPDVKVTAKLPDATGGTTTDRVVLYLRVANPGQQENMGAYECRFFPDDSTIRLGRWGIGTLTVLDTDTSVDLSDGDKIGCEIEGDTLKAWVDQGSGWTEVLSATDTTYTESGYTGVFVSTAAYAIDDIGAQTLGSGPPLTFEGLGTIVDTTDANPAVPLPAGILANDIVWIHCAVKNTTNDHTYSNGFTRAYMQDSGGVRHSLAWKRMSHGESGNVTVTIPGSDLKVCRSSLWRGVRMTGNPYEAITTASQLSATSVDPPAVTVSDGTMVVSFTASDNNFGGIDTMSGGTGTETPTTAYHYDTSTANDATLALFYAKPTTTGSVDVGADTNIGGTVSTRSFTVSLAGETLWVQSDVGDVGLPGSYGLSSGTFSVEGSGSDINDTADEFYYVFQKSNGNAEIVARVASIEATGTSAIAGVMIRESLAAGSKYAAMMLEEGSGADFKYRATTDGSTTTTAAGTNPSAPHWVKLVRSGNTLEGYHSSDGQSWTLVDSKTVPMNTTVYVGLAVSSRDDATLNTSTFDNVSVQ